MEREGEMETERRIKSEKARRERERESVKEENAVCTRHFQKRVNNKAECRE